MASQGPNNPTAAASVDGANIAWSNPSNIFTSNLTYATSSISNAHPTQYLQGTSYGFTIPAGATINGIVVGVQKYGEVDQTFTDLTVQLIKGGVRTGTNKANTVTTWAASPGGYTTYGTGLTDLWGTTWTDTDINSTGFGIAFQAQSNDPSAFIAYVDNIQITVYYTPSVVTEISVGQGLILL